MLLDPQALPSQTLRSMMDQIVVPRPVALISTLGEHGAVHLAAVSWYSTACAYPPVQYFSVMAGDDPRVWTMLGNIRCTGDFVINTLDETLGSRLLPLAVGGPPGADWFRELRLTALPSVKAKAPRVGESPAHLECTLLDLLDLGSGAATVVFGAVVQIHVRDDVQFAGKIDFARFQAIGQLAGASWCRTTDVYELAVPAVNAAADRRRRLLEE